MSNSCRMSEILPTSQKYADIIHHLLKECDYMVSELNSLQLISEKLAKCDKELVKRHEELNRYCVESNRYDIRIVKQIKKCYIDLAKIVKCDKKVTKQFEKIEKQINENFMIIDVVRNLMLPSAE